MLSLSLTFVAQTVNKAVRSVSFLFSLQVPGRAASTRTEASLQQYHSSNDGVTAKRVAIVATGYGKPFEGRAMLVLVCAEGADRPADGPDVFVFFSAGGIILAA